MGFLGLTKAPPQKVELGQNDWLVKYRQIPAKENLTALEVYIVLHLSKGSQIK